MHWHFVFLLLFAPCTTLSGESLHALIACDTFSDLRSSTKKDIAHVKTALHEISIQTGLRLTTHLLHDDTLTADNVRAWIQSIEKKPTDVVVFYYSGHGFRSQNMQTQWPRLFFSKKRESFSSDILYEHLYVIRSRLVIIILDCCNTFLASKIPEGLALTKNGSHQKTPLPGLKTLFLRTRGIIMAAGSSPGEAAFALDSGGVFTNSFIQALSSETTSENSTWNNIFDRTSETCSPMQRPISSLHIASIARTYQKESLHRPRAKESHAGSVKRHSTEVETIIRMARLRSPPYRRTRTIGRIADGMPACTHSTIFKDSGIGR